jgi:hypothetical protein
MQGGMAIRSFRNQATEDINYNRDSKPARRLLPVILHMPNSLLHTIKVKCSPKARQFYG